MTSPVDPQVLWQQWFNQQAEWNQLIQQQTVPAFKEALGHIQAASTLYQDVAQQILPHTLETSLEAQKVQWLQALQDTMSKWAQRQHGVSRVDTTAEVFQTQVQQWAQVQQAIQRYQQAASSYQTDLEQLNQRVFAVLESTLMHGNSEITSLQELIDQWGKTYEHTYAQWTQSQEYQTLYAELVNAGVALKAAFQTQLQPLLQWLNVPSHQDLKLMAERYHELRRAHHKLQEQFEALTEQVAALTRG